MTARGDQLLVNLTWLTIMGFSGSVALTCGFVARGD